MTLASNVHSRGFISYRGCLTATGAAWATGAAATGAAAASGAAAAAASARNEAVWRRLSRLVIPLCERRKKRQRGWATTVTCMKGGATIKSADR